MSSIVCSVTEAMSNVTVDKCNNEVNIPALSISTTTTATATATTATATATTNCTPSKVKESTETKNNTGTKIGTRKFLSNNSKDITSNENISVSTASTATTDNNTDTETTTCSTVSKKINDATSTRNTSVSTDSVNSKPVHDSNKPFSMSDISEDDSDDENESDDVYDEIPLSDMTFVEDEGKYTYPCPCGDLFEIFLEDLEDGEDIAYCPSCSLKIRVLE
jgi:hypothetical protein